MKRSKRILSAILVVLLLASTLNGFVFAAGDDSNIAYVEKYEDLATALNGSATKIVLTADITANDGVTFAYNSDANTVTVTKGDKIVTLDAATLEATSEKTLADLNLNKWSMIGNFNGKTFDGNGHKISGLYTTGGGMFGTINSASTIKNLKFENSLVANKDQGVAGTVAQFLYGSLENVIVEGAVVISTSTTANYPHIGGVVGQAYASGSFGSEVSASLKNVTFNGDVVAANTGKNPHIGGIVGQVKGAILLNCINYGNVSVIAGTRYGLGGVVGCIEGYEGNSTDANLGKHGDTHVLNCANLGNVTDYTTNKNDNTAIGGIVGNAALAWFANSEFWFINLYNAGNIKRFNGTQLVVAGCGITYQFNVPDNSNTSYLTDGDGNPETFRARFIRLEKGIVKFLFASNTAQANAHIPGVSETVFATGNTDENGVTIAGGNAAGTPEYTVRQLNSGAMTIDGACAWKVVDGKCVPQLNTTIVDSVDFDKVKYYYADDTCANENLLATYTENVTKSTNAYEVNSKYRLDCGQGHLQSRIGITSASAGVGNSFEIKFNGTGIQWDTYFRDTSMSDIEIYIDGQYVETVIGDEHKAANYSGDHTLLHTVADIDNLTFGEHTFRAVQLTNKTMCLDYFIIDGEALETPVRVFETENAYKKVDGIYHVHLFEGEDDEGFLSKHTGMTKANGGKCTVCGEQIWVDAADYDYVKYFDKNGNPVPSAHLASVRQTGRDKTDSEHNAAASTYGWGYYGATRYMNSNAFVSNQTGNAFEIVFEGTQLEWWTDFRNTTMANVKITLDGVESTLLGETYAAANMTGDHVANYKIYTTGTLEDEVHTFRAEALNSNLMILDYLVVNGTPVKSTVAPDKVEEPLIYNATEQTGVVGVNTCVGDDVHYTLSGETEKTDAGEYTATATLKDGYVWSDGTTDAKQIPWSIAKAPVTVKANDKEAEYGADLPDFDATVDGLYDDGYELEYDFDCDATDTSELGEFTITVTVDEEDQGNYYVICENGTLTVGHTHTKGNDIMHNGAAHWYACDNCPRLGEVSDYEAAFEADPALKDILGYEEHNFEYGYCETCEFLPLPDYWDELKVKGITYNNADKTISVAFNTPDENVDMSNAAKLIVYASKDDVAHLPELFAPQNILVEGEDYELTYEDNNAVVTFAYDYKFVSIGIKNSEIALNPLEFFMLDDGVSEEEGDEDDDEELKLKKWIACNTDGAPKSEFDFVFFTTREEVQIATDSKLLTTDTYDAYSYGESDYQISLFNNAMLIDSQLLTSKYLRVATLANNEYEVKLQLVAQDVGGLLGYQESLSNSNYHRILAPITMDETDAIVNYVTVRGWYGENFEYELDYLIDCVYTAYYDHSTLVDVATTLNVNGESAFAVIVIDGEGETHTGFDGPIYVRIYSDATDEYGYPILLRDGVLILG